MYKLAPSLLAADFARLESEIRAVETAGAHYLHLDVMDGHFVPNISFGPPVIKSIRKISGMVFDVHLMIESPERYIGVFADAGADIINVHAEACSDLRAVVKGIKSMGKSAAATIKPNTGVSCLFDVLGELGMVLIMSVEPGFGGQGIIYETLKKAEELAEYAAKNGLTFDIEVDGGIYAHNVRDALNAGVNVVVAGSAVFGAGCAAEAVKDFYKIFAEFGE